MLPAARSLAEFTLGEETVFASTIQQVFSGAFPTYDAMFVASLRTKWTAAEMVQMRGERDLLDVTEDVKKVIEDNKTRWRTDVSAAGGQIRSVPSFVISSPSH